MVDEKDKEKEKVMDHEYDGIREIDNNLPRWWLWIFNISVVGGLIYLAHYSFGPGESSLQIFEKQLGTHQEKMTSQNKKEEKGFTDEELAAVVADKGSVVEGEKIYQVRCASCHRQDGGGGVGPNLTDDVWLHGGGVKDIAVTVSDGIPEKGMIAWKVLLSRDEILKVTAFVKSISGTNVPNGKAPEGEKTAP